MRITHWGWLIAVTLFAAYCLEAAELRVPPTVPAGTEFSIATSGSGKATFYLVGPSFSVKREVRLGDEIHIRPEEIRSAGRYLALVRGSGNDSSASFYVVATNAADLSFLAHPSRVPVARGSGILGVVFVFDKYKNLVRQPETVDFRLAVKDAPAVSQSVQSRDGVAWTRMNSSRKAGNAQFVASLQGANEKRVIQQVASDPCNLRLKAQRSPKGIEVETDPVRDCTGNPVSDGTVVTFTAADSSGTSTVDAPIKKGVARATLKAAGPATISVASGVVMGNEVRVGGSQ